MVVRPKPADRPRQAHSKSDSKYDWNRNTHLSALARTWREEVCLFGIEEKKNETKIRVLHNKLALNARSSRAMSNIKYSRPGVLTLMLPGKCFAGRRCYAVADSGAFVRPRLAASMLDDVVARY
jgi:hypothetical protein